jgi:hypothetical protein
MELMSTAKGEFLNWIAYLRLQADDPATIRGIDQIRDRGLEMYDEGYLAASCDRDHAIMEDLYNLAAKYSWM